MIKRKVSSAHRIRKTLRSRESIMHPRHDFYKWVLLANVMIGTFMAVLDSTIVNVGLPKIMASFGVGLDKIEWVVTAYMLSMAVMLPTTGWLADKYGYKRMYFFGLFLFTIGSLLCGMSTDENTLIISRIIQGLGAGTIQPLGMAIITREFPPHKRGVALGFWTVAAAASISFGPLIGGYLVDNFSWTWIFDVNIPVGILAMLTTLVVQSEYKSKKLRSFDFVGFCSVVIFLPLTLYALAEGNAVTNSEGWSAPYVMICFAIAIIALAVFITAELTLEEPLIDLRLLLNRNFGLSNIVLFVFSIGMFGSTFLMPMYLQNSLGYTALQAGSVFLPVGILQGCISPIAGIFSDKTNPKIPMFIGVVLFTISFYMNGWLSPFSENSYIMSSLYLRGFAMGLFYPPLSSMSLSMIPREKMAQASGITNTIRQLGGSLGVAILATILTLRVNYHSQMYGESLQPRSQEYANTVRHISTQIQHNSGTTPGNATKLAPMLVVSDITKQAYISGIDDDFLVAACFTILGAIPIFLMRVPKKEKKKSNESPHTDVYE